jgi:hypothetical protein
MVIKLGVEAYLSFYFCALPLFFKGSSLFLETHLDSFSQIAGCEITFWV